jgi:uncharacterized RDD family membrane protein YckC
MSDAAPPDPQSPPAPQPAYTPPAPTPEAPGGAAAPPGHPFAPYPGQPPAPPAGPQVPPGGWYQPVVLPPTPDYGELAGWGRRGAAVALDFLFVWVPIAAVVGIVAAVAAASSTAAIVTGVLLGLASLAYWFLGRSLLMARKGDRNGQTWGKQIVGIRAIRDRGEPFDIGWSLLRQVAVKWLLFYGIGGTLFIPWMLDYLWPLWDDQNRALHDMVVSTHVVRA